nr:polysaccharide lyase family 7 protein [Fodinicola feengrottensis]
MTIRAHVQRTLVLGAVIAAVSATATAPASQRRTSSSDLPISSRCAEFGQLEGNPAHWFVGQPDRNQAAGAEDVREVAVVRAYLRLSRRAVPRRGERCHHQRFRLSAVGVAGNGQQRDRKRELVSGLRTHTMVIDEAITHLPNDKPQVVAGQIHDADDDVTVFRLEGTNLYVTDGNTTHHKLVTSNYQLGTQFEAKFVASGGQIQAYYNGVLQTTIANSSSSDYFKAGAYTQANCGNSDPCSSSNYGEVIIYQVTVTHQ